MDLKQHIERIKDFPKPGIVFRDITPLLAHPKVFTHAIGVIVRKWAGSADAVAALDARGFLFGSPVALALNLPLIMIRKKGKLPGKVLSHTYALEYGEDTIEMKPDVVTKGMRVLVVDDLLATGGTAVAACSLIQKAGGIVAGCAFVAELDHLYGRAKLSPHLVQSLVVYSGEE